MPDWLSIGEAVGLVLLGLLSIVTQRVTLRTEKATNRTHKAVEPNGETLSAILHEIRAGGETNRELLREVIAGNEYEHTRAHDILNSLQRIEARQQQPS